MGAIYRVEIEKVMDNTGTAARPYFVKSKETKVFYLFGIRIKSVTILGTYPDQDLASNK